MAIATKTNAPSRIKAEGATNKGQVLTNALPLPLAKPLMGQEDARQVSKVLTQRELDKKEEEELLAAKLALEELSPALETNVMGDVLMAQASVPAAGASSGAAATVAAPASAGAGAGFAGMSSMGVLGVAAGVVGVAAIANSGGSSSSPAPAPAPAPTLKTYTAAEAFEIIGGAGPLPDANTYSVTGGTLNTAFVLSINQVVLASARYDLLEAGAVEFGVIETTALEIRDTAANLLSYGDLSEFGANAVTVLDNAAGVLTVEDHAALTELTTDDTWSYSIADTLAVLVVEGEADLIVVNATGVTIIGATTAAAADLNALNLAAPNLIDATVLTVVTGSAADVAAYANASITEISKSTIWTATISGTTAAAADLVAIDLNNGSGNVSATLITTLTGTAADILAVDDATSIVDTKGWAATVDAGATLTELAAVAAATTGVVTATISGTILELLALEAGNAWAMTVTGEPAIVDQLNDLDALTSGIITADVSDTAAELATLTDGDNNYTVTITGEVDPTVTQLLAIADATTLPVIMTNVLAVTGGGDAGNFLDLAASASSFGPGTWTADVGTLESTDVESLNTLNTLNAMTTGMLTAEISGTAAEMAALTANEGEVGNAFTVTLSAGSASAADLLAIDAITTVAVNVSNVTVITGSNADILLVAAAYGDETFTLGNWSATLADTVTVAQANSIDAANGTGILTATIADSSLEDLVALTTIPNETVNAYTINVTGVLNGDDVADLVKLDGLTTGVISASISSNLYELDGLDTKPSNDFTITITDPLEGGDVAALNALDGKTAGVITATIDGSADALGELTAGDNLYTVTVSAGAANAVDLLAIDAATTLTVTANLVTSINGTAEDILAVKAAPGILTTDVWGTDVTGEATVAELFSLDDLTTGTVDASEVTVVSGSVAELKSLQVAEDIILNTGWYISVTDPSVSIADANILDDYTGAAVTATIASDTAFNLNTLNATNNNVYHLTVTDPQEGAEGVIALNLLDAKTIGVITASLSSTLLQAEQLATQEDEVNAYTVILDDTVLDGTDVAALNTLDGKTTGVITATLEGTATEMAELGGTGNAYAITLTGPGATAEDLLSIEATTTLVVDATEITELSGIASDVAKVIGSATITKASDVDVTVDDGDKATAALDLLAIDAGTTVEVDASSVIAIIGSAEAILAVIDANGIFTSEAWDVKVTGTPTVAQLNAIGTYTSGVVTAEITGTAEVLAELLPDGGANAITVTVSAGPATAADLITIHEATDLTVDALAVTSINGGIKDILDVLGEGDINEPAKFDSNVTDASITVTNARELNEGNGTGIITATIVEGTAEQLLLIGGTGGEGTQHALTTTVEGVASATELTALDAMTSVRVNATGVTQITGTLATVVAVKGATGLNTTGVDVVVTDTARALAAAAPFAATGDADVLYVVGNGLDIDVTQLTGFESIRLNGGQGVLTIADGAGTAVINESGYINVQLGAGGQSFTNEGVEGSVITGGTGNDYVVGGLGEDVIIGGTGSDYLRGSTLGAIAESATGATDVDTMFGGAVSDLIDGVYAESVDSNMGDETNASFASVFAPWSEAHGTAFDGANIFEGKGGDDILVASDAKDVFVYKTFSQDILNANVEDNQSLSAQNYLGTDSIHNFKIGTDALGVVMDVGGGDVTFVSGTTEGNDFNASTNGWSLSAFNESDPKTATLSFDASAGTSYGDSGIGELGDFSINLVGLQGFNSETTVDQFFIA